MESLEFGGKFLGTKHSLHKTPVHAIKHTAGTEGLLGSWRSGEQMPFYQ